MSPSRPAPQPHQAANVVEVEAIAAVGDQRKPARITRLSPCSRCPESHGMPDAIFEDQRLVSIYDALDSDRQDLDVYAAMIDEFGSKTVIDLGCGTGLLARRLARSGVTVTG